MEENNSWEGIALSHLFPKTWFYFIWHFKYWEILLCNFCGFGTVWLFFWLVVVLGIESKASCMLSKFVSFILQKNSKIFLFTKIDFPPPPSPVVPFHSLDFRIYSAAHRGGNLPLSSVLRHCQSCRPACFPWGLFWSQQTSQVLLPRRAPLFLWKAGSSSAIRRGLVLEVCLSSHL